MTKDDYSLFKSIAILTPDNLRNTMEKLLREKYKEVYSTDRYIYAIGTIPIALIAHMDTVFQSPPSKIYYDAEQTTFWSPDGLGADDRAGIYAILKIMVETHCAPTIILTMDEEIGGLGADRLIKDFESPKYPLKYIIELDRAGEKDCVFYNCNNKSFEKYIQQFGFEIARGTFTDISIICPVWGVAGVNLSVGYENEHSLIEHFNISILSNTIKAVIQMLNDKDAPSFNYIAHEISICDNCHQERIYDLIPCYNKDGQVAHICYNCIGDDAQVGWCNRCGHLFIKDIPTNDLCHNCRDKR